MSILDDDYGFITVIGSAQCPDFRGKRHECGYCERVFENFLRAVQERKLRVTKEMMAELHPAYKPQFVEFICLRAIDDR